MVEQVAKYITWKVEIACVKVTLEKSESDFDEFDDYDISFFGTFKWHNIT